MDAAAQLEAIAEVTTLGIEVWLRGGWAMDLFLGKVTRPHRDVDWFAWSSDADRLATALMSRGYELLPEPAHDRQLDFVRGGLDLSFALIARDEAGCVIVAGGPWAGQRWPDGMLDWPAGRIGDLRCPIISPSAQIEIKTMMPIWVPGTPRRPKDAVDIALLEAALASQRPCSPTLRRVIVRMADVADVAVLAELQDIEPDTFAAYADWVAAHAATHLPFVAEVDGYVVGAAWLLVAERVPRGSSLDRRYGDVQSVMVREQYRNRGVGAALMAAVLAEARTRDLVHVTVRSGRRAVDFYLRNGFSHHRQLLLHHPGGA